MEKNSAIVPISMSERGVQLKSMEDAYRFAVAVSKSGLAPRSLDTPEKVLVALQTGLEAGLSPMKAIQSVVVINGLPSWKGDTALALARASGKMEWFKKGVEGDGENRCAWVESKRIDEPEPVKTTFCVADAKRAGLWGKQGPWTQYPGRMTYYRALGFHLRDQYSDVLSGLAISEEVQDYPPRIEATAATPPAQAAPEGSDPLLQQLESTPAIEEPGAVEPDEMSDDEKQAIIEQERIEAEAEDAAQAKAFSG